MKERGRDPLRLDVESLAKAGESIEGQWPMRQLPRLWDSTHPESRPAPEDSVHWQARGELRAVRAGAAQIWLHVAAQAALKLECQRCLQAVAAPLSVQRSFRFVAGEAVAVELDADCEDDVLALTRALDLRELVEDELLLGLPLVPRHDVCPAPLLAPQAEEAPLEERPNPFAALARLKGKTGH